MREKIGKITLDDTCYSGSDLYSDGPVEKELLEIAKSCHTPEEYNQVITERKSWPVMYHFSHILWEYSELAAHHKMRIKF